MNIIRELVEMFPDEKKQSIDKVIAHLHAAEKHYERGKNSGDEQFFTDVICRCYNALGHTFDFVEEILLWP